MKKMVLENVWKLYRMLDLDWYFEYIKVSKVLSSQFKVQKVEH